MFLARRYPLLTVCACVFLVAFALSGCDQQNQPTPLPSSIPATGPTFIDVESLTPDRGCAGDVIVVRGHGFDLDPAGNSVVFAATNDPNVRLHGQVLSVTAIGPDAMGLITELEVVVPTACRTSLVEVYTVDGGDRVFAGSAAFDACPVILGLIYGPDNRGYAGLNVLSQVDVNVNVIAYGYNMDNLSTAMLVDEGGNIISPTSVSSTLPPNMPPLPDGLTASNILLSAGTSLSFTCFEQGSLECTAVGPVGTPALVSNKAEIRFARQFPTGDDFGLNGAISALATPAGVRSGPIEIAYALLSDPVGRWDVTPQYWDPVALDYFDCTLIQPVEEPMAAGRVESPQHPALLGRGRVNEFHWDSAADLPGRGQTHIRIVLDEITNLFFCPDYGSWQSEPIAYDNTATVAGSGSGQICEEFTTDQFLDTANSDAGVWGSGQLTGGSVTLTEADLYGTGFIDVVLANGGSYVVDTDAATIELAVGGTPVLSALDNPGATLNEFHVRTFLVEQHADVQIIGSNPLIVRAAGIGITTDVAIRIDGTLDVSGGDGEVGTDQGGGGAGGIGIAGGFDGGIGGYVTTRAVVVQDIFPAEAGAGPGGGGPGECNAWISLSQPIGRGGPGGGGGHATAGLPGVNNDPSNSIVNFRPGDGGAAYGDAALTEPSGGSGGGGGGTGPRFVPANQTLSPKAGGGGGAGGGVMDFWANGVIAIGDDATLYANGGRGGLGSSGPYGGQGGGGSGGSIACRGRGGVTVAGSASIEARGGEATHDSHISTTFFSGAGAPGRIRFESDGPVGIGGGGSFAGITLPDEPFAPGPLFAHSVPAATGVDGALHLQGLPPGTTWTLDTGNSASDPITVRDHNGQIIVQSAGAGVLELTEFIIAEGLTLRGVGTQPIVIRVVGDAVIDGTFDASGGPGGLVDSSAVLLPGTGGIAGPGGGRGGDGGVAIASAHAPAERGGMPPTLPAYWQADDAPYSTGGATSLPIPVDPAFAARGGRNESVLAGLWAAGGGGGGHATSGEWGRENFGPNESGGRGGDTFSNAPGFDPLLLVPLVVGGGGGGGGGAGLGGTLIAHSPGTGGGGGGGAIDISANNILIGSNAALLALGGDAFDGPFEGANGGAGAGGSVSLYATNIVHLGGGEIDARGGTANRPPGEHPDPAQVAAATYVPNASDGGGNGGFGWIRISGAISFPIDSVSGTDCSTISKLGICPVPSIGVSLLSPGVALSQVQTTTYPVAAVPGVIAGRAEFLSTTLLPADPDTRLLMRGARQDRGVPGRVGKFSGWTDDPALLRHAEFVQLRFLLYGQPLGGGSVTHPIADSAKIDFSY